MEYKAQATNLRARWQANGFERVTIDTKILGAKCSTLHLFLHVLAYDALQKLLNPCSRLGSPERQSQFAGLVPQKETSLVQNQLRLLSHVKTNMNEFVAGSQCFLKFSRALCMCVFRMTSQVVRGTNDKESS